MYRYQVRQGAEERIVGRCRFCGTVSHHRIAYQQLGDPLKKVTEIYGLSLGIFDMGWPAAASVAYNTSVGAFIIPVCLAVNIVMLLTKTTKTVNIDLWNYWHFAFIGAVIYFATDNIWWGFLLQSSATSLRW